MTYPLIVQQLFHMFISEVRTVVLPQNDSLMTIKVFSQLNKHLKFFENFRFLFHTETRAEIRVVILQQ